MVMHDHICPFGTKSKYLLEKEGYVVEDHHLKSRQETDAFMQKHQVKTTPQTFIDGKRIGGYDDLRNFFHKSPSPNKDDKSYAPVAALFGMSLVMAVGLTYSEYHRLPLSDVIHTFGALSMCALAIQKLRDLFSFSNSFLNYDILGLKFVPYSYVYPLTEAFVGITMLANVLPYLSGPLAIAIGAEGSISVFKAVYLDKRELKCACMGGDSKVPLGFISLTENLLMVAMGIWTVIRIS